MKKNDLEMHMHNNHPYATDFYDLYVNHHKQVIEKDKKI